MPAQPDLRESSVLTEGVLSRIRSRASTYDQNNEFFHEDLEELREIGYLSPRSLPQMIADQR